MAVLPQPPSTAKERRRRKQCRVTPITHAFSRKQLIIIQLPCFSLKGTDTRKEERAKKRKEREEEKERSKREEQVKKQEMAEMANSHPAHSQEATHG